MPAIQIGSKTLVLAADAQLALERNSSWLSPREQNGNYSLPLQAPFTESKHNQALLGFPERFDHAGQPPRRYDGVQAYDEVGNQVAEGQLVLQGIEAEGYSLNLVCGLSAVMARLKQKKLREFYFDGPRLVATGTVSGWGQYQTLVVQHMLTVVDNVDDYDYVFAPFSNNDAYTDHDADSPRWPNMNHWENDGFVLTHGYVAPAVGEADPAAIYTPAVKSSCVPLPKLKYVLETIFAELNIPFETDLFDELEMQQLVVLSTTPIEHDVDWYNWLGTTPTPIELKFRIGNQLPDLNAAEFVRKLADTFYLDLNITALGTVQMMRTSHLATAPPAQDITQLVGPAFSRDVTSLAVQATYTTSDDAATSSLTQEIAPELLSAPVEFRFSLAAPTRPNETRYVEHEKTYYQHDGTTWRPYWVEKPLVTVGSTSADAGVQDIAQGITLTLEQDLTANPEGPGYRMRLPVIGERVYAPLFNQNERSGALRLAFYRGIQSYWFESGGYPMLSEANLDVQGRRIGNASLYLDGEDGLVARYGRAYLNLLTEQPAKFPAYLTGYQFSQLDFSQPVSVRGDVFIIRRSNITLPITKAGSLELVPRRERLG